MSKRIFNSIVGYHRYLINNSVFIDHDLLTGHGMGLNKLEEINDI